FSPSSDRLYAGGAGSVLRAWDTVSGRLLWTAEEVPESFYSDQQLANPPLVLRRRRYVGCLAVSPDGALLAVGFGYPFAQQVNYPQIVRICNADTGRILQTLSVFNAVHGLRFVEGGQKLVVGSADGTVRIWKSQGGTWEPAVTWQAGEHLTALTVSPDGNQV